MTGPNVGRRDDAIAIWRAGVEAVNSERLVRNCVAWTNGQLEVAGLRFDLRAKGRIVVVGAGKAGAGMASGLEQALADTPAFERIVGWINVPADCVRPLRKFHLHAARPAGVNEPTEEGVAGSLRILQMVRELREDDVCIVLLSGGGSALLPAPVAGISLADKLAVTRLLMSSGATIHELNCVRKHLSQIKGGMLARAAGAHPMIALIISDVVGDPLDVIGSGPTVADRSTAHDALQILERFADKRNRVPESVWSVLREQIEHDRGTGSIPDSVQNFVIGNNAVALDAAARKAAELGYNINSLGSANQGVASDVGRELALQCQKSRDNMVKSHSFCALSGGEPVVELAPTDQPRKGGRNQELVLAAVCELWDDGMDGITILSGGTDGEDGPTDAAGAIADAELIREAKRLGLEPWEFLAINNSYPFFEQTGGLFKTGPTNTNVMDLRVALIERPT